jgi:hypothetical protein
LPLNTPWTLWLDRFVISLIFSTLLICLWIFFLDFSLYYFGFYLVLFLDMFVVQLQPSMQQIWEKSTPLPQFRYVVYNKHLWFKTLGERGGMAFCV